MASVIGSQILGAELKIVPKNFETTSALSASVGWIDMRDYDSILAQYLRVSGTGTFPKFQMVVSAASNGSGTLGIVKSGVTTTDAVGDYQAIEATVDEIREVGIAAGIAPRYVGVKAAHGTYTDTGVVVFVAKGKHQGANLTANSIA